MVFFNCNSCGESLKKNQVEKHYQFKCRSCEVVSCVDCGKDFWGDSYNEHTKCITEEAKYSGKDYKPKPNANKGEVKQDKWIREVQAAIDRASTNPQLRQLLERIKEFGNIPRKKAKFENFVKNSMRVHDSRLVGQVWDLLSPSQPQAGKEDNAGNNQPQPTKESTNQEAPKENGLSNDTAEEDPDKKKLSKRERKEERRKKQNKEEKKDQHKEDTENVDEDSSSAPKKHKKRKHQEEESGEESSEDSSEQNGKQKKKKKRKIKEKEETEEPKTKKRKKKHEDEDQEEEEEEASLVQYKWKWEGVIIGALRAADNKELSIKRLRKKVLAEYEARVGDGKPQETLLAKFNKKIHKNPRLKVHKDKVKLIK